VSGVLPGDQSEAFIACTVPSMPARHSHLGRRSWSRSSTLVVEPAHITDISEGAFKEVFTYWLCVEERNATRPRLSPLLSAVQGLLAVSQAGAAWQWRHAIRPI
jgi:hypothetical protein